MNIIYPENENSRTSNRRNAVKSYKKVNSEKVKLCSSCFCGLNVTICKNCQKPFCCECLNKNICSECYDKRSLFSCCFKY